MSQRKATHRPLNRRQIIGAGVGAAGIGAMPAQASQGTALAHLIQTGTPEAASSPVATDGYFPGGAEGVPDAYTVYPEPYQSISGVPGNGGSVSIFKATQMPPATPKDENVFWQELDNRLGVTTEIVSVPLDAYGERFATLFASGDLPDIMLLWFELAPAVYEYIDQGAFTDLTPYLTGDALLEYPNLSQYPDWAWRNARLNDKIYMVPRMNFLYGDNTLNYRQDWAETLGIPEPRNADEVFDLLVGMSTQDPDGNGQADTWGLGSAWGMSFFNGMYRVPNNWRLNDDGTLTKDIETEEFREALAFARRLFEAGAYHPDVASLSSQQNQDELIAGNIGAREGALLMLGGKRLISSAREVNPAANVRVLVPPGFDGGQGVTYNSNGNVYANGIPASKGEDEERVRELLRILDYFGALFGTAEYNFLYFGLPEIHHTIDDNGSPVQTERGSADIADLQNTGFPPRVYFFPDQLDEDVLYTQEMARQVLAVGIDDPAANLISPTQISNTVELDQLNQDRQTAIITGRDPLEALDTWISEWRSRGGDDIRRELEEQLNA